MIQALTLQSPKLRDNWGSFYLFKEDELVSSGGALLPKAEAVPKTSIISVSRSPAEPNGHRQLDKAQVK